MTYLNGLSDLIQDWNLHEVKTHLRIGPMKSHVCLKCQPVAIYINKGFRCWTLSFDSCNGKNGKNVFHVFYWILVRGPWTLQGQRLYSVNISVLNWVRSMTIRSCKLCIVLFLKFDRVFVKKILQDMYLSRNPTNFYV